MVGIVIYCSEKKSFWTKIISKGIPCWLPSRCQICVIPEKFDKLESFVNKHRFNMTELRRYYDKLQKELIKSFYDLPRSTECFLVEGHYFGSRDCQTGHCWSVFLSESIWYSDNIFLASQRIKTKRIIW